MTKTTKGIIIVVGVLAVVYIGYRLVYKPTTGPTKRQMADYLIQYNYYNSSEDQLLAFGDDFVAAWYAAAVAAKPTFVLNGKTYNSSGGKAVT